MSKSWIWLICVWHWRFHYGSLSPLPCDLLDSVYLTSCPFARVTFFFEDIYSLIISVGFFSVNIFTVVWYLSNISKLVFSPFYFKTFFFRNKIQIIFKSLRAAALLSVAILFKLVCFVTFKYFKTNFITYIFHNLFPNITLEKS